MARFRRRKPAVQWLPLTVTNVVSAGGVRGNFYADSFTIPPLFGARSSQMYTIIPDYPASAIRQANQIPSLGDWEGSAYRLRRIVGKVFAGMEQNIPPQGSTYPMACLLTVAYEIIRVDEAAGAPLRAADAYSPQDLDNIQDPFIWRRSWVLTNDFGGNAQAQPFWQWAPRGTPDYGSAWDGPHIDARTARRVSDEERLIALVSCTNISGDADLAGGGRIVLETRALASALRPAGNRRNASR